MSRKPLYRPLGMAFILAFQFSCNNSEESIKPEITSLTESVYASLVVQPDQLYQVHSAISGIIENIWVVEGDSIMKGAPLIQVKNTNPRLNLENARLALDMAKSQYEGRANVLNELRSEIEIAELRLANDSTNYVKQRSLWEKNIGTQNTFESKELAYKTSKANLQLLQNRLTRTEKDLFTALKEAQNNYANAQNTNQDYTIESKVDGKVYNLFKEPGEIISQQEPIATVGHAVDFIIEMEVDEVDIAQVEKGQPVVITLDAYPGTTFDAHVSRIYPTKNVATQTFKVEARFTRPPEKLFPGLSGEANIIIKTRSNVMVIPRAYLNGNNEIRTDQGLIRVTTGLESLDKIEIRSGIDTTMNLYQHKQ